MWQMWHKIKHTSFGKSTPSKSPKIEHKNKIVRASSIPEIKSYAAIRLENGYREDMQTMLFQGEFNKSCQRHAKDLDRDKRLLPPMYFPIRTNQDEVALDKRYSMRSPTNIYIACLDCPPEEAEKIIKDGQFHTIIIGIKKGGDAKVEAIDKRRKVKDVDVATLIRNPNYKTPEISNGDKLSPPPQCI